MSDAPKTGNRRDLLKKAAGLTGLAAIALASPRADAAASMTKSAAKYQKDPKDGHQCSGCSLYIPGASSTADGKCKVVEGSIDPKGWCQLWSPKSA